MEIQVQIKRWWDAKVLFEATVPESIEEPFRIKFALELAVKAGARLDGARLDGARLDGASLDGASLVRASLVRASLDGARLDGARLDGASLDGASLVRASLVRASLVRASLDGASLDGASLDGASLVRASLDGASLVRASLDGARLDGASLDGASLDGARLVRASLDGARLDGASLDGASLDGADLTPIRDDIWAVFSSSPAEVPAVVEALKAGRVDGSTYTGECACLVGTIGNARGKSVNSLGPLKPNSNRPAERFFLAIHEGDTPETNQFSKLALEWAEEWLANMRAAFCSNVDSTDQRG